MTRSSRALCCLYLTVTTWSAICAALTHDQVPAWTTVVMAAASITPLLAMWRECDLRDERRHVAALLERQAREQQRLNGRPLNQHEQADWQRLLARLNLTGPDDDRSSTT